MGMNIGRNDCWFVSCDDPYGRGCNMKTELIYGFKASAATLLTLLSDWSRNDKTGRWSCPSCLTLNNITTNGRDRAIRDWLVKNRMDLVPLLSQWFQIEALHALLAIAFEAGRQFQHDTNAELDDPSIYLNDIKYERKGRPMCSGVPTSPREI